MLMARLRGFVWGGCVGQTFKSENWSLISKGFSAAYCLPVRRLTAHMRAACILGKGWCDSTKRVAASADGEMPLSEFMVPTALSSACRVPTHSCMLIFGLLFQKERKWTLHANYFLTFFPSTNGLCFQDIFLYIETCVPWHFTPLPTKALGMTVWLSEMGMEETYFRTDCWNTVLLNTSRSFESVKRV